MKHAATTLKIVLTAVLLLTCSCSSWYYGMLETLGTSKRELFKTRVVAARDAQTDAKEQFASALERFRSLKNFDGGKLEETYESLNDEFEKSEDKADRVKKRIESLESVSEALFDEWEDEIGQYSNQALQHSSEKKFREARKNYTRLMQSMHAAESRLDPALTPMRDQVLFLKHNLNAKAVASLEGELANVEFDVSTLLQNLQQSIAHTDEYIRTLEE